LNETALRAVVADVVAHAQALGGERGAQAVAMADGRRLETSPALRYFDGVSGRRHFRAVFEKGVLRPLEQIDAQEGEVIELLVPAASWEEDLEDLLRERAAVSGQFSADEVAEDVREAIADVRRGQRGA
jgi:predicted DNA-binding antitoxin AbrB/MazE fold protein